MDFHLSEFLCKCGCGGGVGVIAPQLLLRLQRVRNDWGKPMIVDCGYRCAKHNAAVGGAPNSAHLTGEAADIADADGALKTWLSEEMLAGYGLWAESYDSTPTWCHLQVRPASRRIFEP